MLNIKFIGTILTGFVLGAAGSYLYLEKKRKRELLEMEAWEEDDEVVKEYDVDNKKTEKYFNSKLKHDGRVNLNEVIDDAEKELGIKRDIVDLDDWEEPNKVDLTLDIHSNKPPFTIFDSSIPDNNSGVWSVEPNTPGIEILDAFGDIEDGDDWTTDILFFDENTIIDSNYEPLSDTQQIDIIGSGTLEYLVAKAEYTNDNVFYLRNNNLQLSIELYYYESLEVEGMLD